MLTCWQLYCGRVRVQKSISSVSPDEGCMLSELDKASQPMAPAYRLQPVTHPVQAALFHVVWFMSCCIYLVQPPWTLHKREEVCLECEVCKVRKCRFWLFGVFFFRLDKCPQEAVVFGEGMLAALIHITWLLPRVVAFWVELPWCSGRPRLTSAFLSYGATWLDFTPYLGALLLYSQYLWLTYTNTVMTS